MDGPGRYGLPIYHDGWIEVTRNLEWLTDHRDQPDEGIWETPGGRNYTYSRLMSAVVQHYDTVLDARCC